MSRFISRGIAAAAAMLAACGGAFAAVTGAIQNWNPNNGDVFARYQSFSWGQSGWFKNTGPGTTDIKAITLLNDPVGQYTEHIWDNVAAGGSQIPYSMWTSSSIATPGGYTAQHYLISWPDGGQPTTLSYKSGTYSVC